MAQLTVEQLIYLLYACAYIEADTVTKGSVKSHLPDEWKEKAEDIYAALDTQGLIEQKIREGRFSVTKDGIEALVTNLTTTDYKFDSVKGPKVLNVLLDCIGKAAKAYPTKQSDEMSFNEFQEKFKALYFEERREQELRGAVAIYSQRLLQKFAEQNSISQDTLNQYFNLLKTNREIFTVIEKENEMMEWAE